uniref:hypothetical protein n=1 Tax=Spiroplasma endosymbiont of Polydrusus formosus TaxID=3139326 RepID=UPI00404098F2
MLVWLTWIFSVLILLGILRELVYQFIKKLDKFKVRKNKKITWKKGYYKIINLLTETVTKIGFGDGMNYIWTGLSNAISKVKIPYMVFYRN